RLHADFPLLRNGAPIAEADLADGDTLTLGPFTLSVQIRPPADAGQADPPPPIAEPPKAGEPPGDLPETTSTGDAAPAERPPKLPGGKPAFALLRKRPEPAPELADPTALLLPTPTRIDDAAYSASVAARE